METSRLAGPRDIKLPPETSCPTNVAQHMLIPQAPTFIHDSSMAADDDVSEQRGLAHLMPFLHPPSRSTSFLNVTTSINYPPQPTSTNYGSQSAIATSRPKRTGRDISKPLNNPPRQTSIVSDTNMPFPSTYSPSSVMLDTVTLQGEHNSRPTDCSTIYHDVPLSTSSRLTSIALNDTPFRPSSVSDVLLDPSQSASGRRSMSTNNSRSSLANVSHDIPVTRQGLPMQRTTFMPHGDSAD
jgi:hypothetical protein